jgi:hypothetical protein
VVQVIKNRPAVDELAGAAEMIKTGTNVRILPQTPTFVIFVPAVDGEKVVPPHRHVATDNAPLGGVSTNDGERQAKAFGSAGHITGKEKPETWDRLSKAKRFGGRSGEIAPTTLDPESFLGQGGVVLNISGVRNAIRISENQIVPCGGSESPVENDVFSKAFVFMP